MYPLQGNARREVAWYAVLRAHAFHANQMYADQRRRAAFRHRTIVAFKLFDVNDDGFLDASELGLLLSVQQQLYGKSRMRKVQFSTASIMSRFDKDGNNKLDFEEFSKALQEPPYTILAGCLQVLAMSESSITHDLRPRNSSRCLVSCTHTHSLPQ